MLGDPASRGVCESLESYSRCDCIASSLSYGARLSSFLVVYFFICPVDCCVKCRVVGDMSFEKNSLIAIYLCVGISCLLFSPCIRVSFMCCSW